MSSDNRLLGMTYTDEKNEPEYRKAQSVTEKAAPEFSARFMYHPTLAPLGYIVRTEAKLNEMLNDPSWVTTPALLGKVQEPIAPVIEPEPEKPTGLVADIVDQQQPSKEELDVAESPAPTQEFKVPPPRPQAMPEPEPDPEPEVFTCDMCGKEFAMAKNLGQHVPKCPNNPNNKRRR